MALDAPGRCTGENCACPAFDSQIYRPGLCVTCFHAISLHFPGLRTEEFDAVSGRVFYKEELAGGGTGRKLLASVSNVNENLAFMREAIKKSRETAKRERAASLTDNTGAALHVDAWATFLQRDADVSTSRELRSRAESSDRTALLAGDQAAAPPSLRVPAGLQVPHTVPDIAEDDDDEEDGRALSVFARSGTSLSLGASATPMRAESAAATIPETPSAVPQAVLDALAIDFTQLTRRLEASAQGVSFEPVPVDAVHASTPIAHTLARNSSSVGFQAHGEGTTTTRLPAAVPFAGISEVDAPIIAEGAGASLVEPLPAPTLALLGEEGVTEGTEGTIGGQSTTSPPNNLMPLPSATGPVVDLSLHLGPVFDDPLTLRLDTPAFSRDKGGVLMFRIAQPHEEDLTVPRYLLVTPFTIIAVAPHPTRLGVGLLKWERSILSLVSVVSQPLFTAVSATAKVDSGTGATSSVDAMFASDRNRAARSDSLSMDDFVLDRLPYGMDRALAGSGSGARAGGSESAEVEGAQVKVGKRSISSAIAGSVRNLLFGKSSVASGTVKAGSAAKVGGSPLLGPVPTQGAEVRYKLSGIGLLACFAPESSDTMTLLRTYRAGKRPQKMQGWLMKRKRSAWREHAPLGPLAWKRRFFSLEPGHITYSKGPGGEAKGLVPLTGWVEVSRVGQDAGPTATLGDATTRAHSFVLRTGRTYHVFQASSSTDADAWVEAIAINAQHAACALDEPQCLILPTHADAENLALAVQKRRADLTASLGATSAYSMTEDILVDLSASQVIAEAAVARQVAKTAEVVHQQDRAQIQQERVWLAEAAQASYPPLHASAGPVRHAHVPAHAGISVADAEALILAMGEASDEFLSQLPRDVQLEIRRRHRPETVQMAMEIFAREDAASSMHAHASAPRMSTSAPRPHAGAAGRGTGHAGPTVAEAEALIVAMGGASDEFLAQLPRDVQLELRRRHRPDTVQAAMEEFARQDAVAHGTDRAGMAGADSYENGSAPTFSGPSVSVGRPISHAAYSGSAPFFWVYLDDQGQVQGPFSEDAMRAWLLARYFGPTTMVHAASPLSHAQLHAHEGGAESGPTLRPVVDASGVPTVFLPLSTLFPEPSRAFCSGGEWLYPYKRATQYQSLYNAALSLGLDRHVALSAVLLMKDNGMAPALDLLLDIVSDADLGAVVTADADVRAQAAGGASISTGDSGSGEGARGTRTHGAREADSEPETPTASLSNGARSDHFVYGKQAGSGSTSSSSSAPGMHMHSPRDESQAGKTTTGQGLAPTGAAMGPRSDVAGNLVAAAGTATMFSMLV